MLRQSDVDLANRVATMLESVVPRLVKLREKAREWERGGLPTSSLPDAITGSAEPPLPGFDKVDGRLHRDERELHRRLVDVANNVDVMDRTLNAWLIPAPSLPDPPECVNVFCTNRVEDGREGGECSRCRVHRHRQGRPYPEKRGE